MSGDALDQQLALCRKYGTSHVPAPPAMKVGIAENAGSGAHPVNGLRLRPEGDTTGWYIWAGEELSADPELFLPLHVEHLDAWAPDVIRFLGLPPGWRFLIAPGHEDVWYDPDLLGAAGS